MATIAETRAANKKRKEQEARDDAEAQKKIDAIRNKRKPKEEDKADEKSFLDKLREMLSPDERGVMNIVDAAQSGVDEADAVAADKDKRKKK